MVYTAAAVVAADQFCPCLHSDRSLLLTTQKEAPQLLANKHDDDNHNPSSSCLTPTQQQQQPQRNTRSKPIQDEGTETSSESSSGTSATTMSQNHHHHQHPSSSASSPPSVVSSSRLRRRPPSDETTTSSLQQQQTVVKDWIVEHGNESPDMKHFITSFCDYLRTHHDIPVDRLYVGFVADEVAYGSLWQAGRPREVRAHTLHNMSRRNTLYGSDAPLNVLYEGRADSVRVRANDPLPAALAEWFTAGGYQDYYGLPLRARGRIAGGVTLASAQRSFAPREISLFQQCVHSLSAVVRGLMAERILGDLRLKSQTDSHQHPTHTQQQPEETYRMEGTTEHQSMQQMAMISHEIRTPLNCIVAMSKLLLNDTPLDDDQKESMQMITQSGDLLLNIVNDVLDYAKLEKLSHETAGERMDKDMFVIRPVKWRGITNAVTRAIEMQCRPRGISIDVQHHGAAANPNLVLHTDGHRLQQILYNLLGNAVKFSHTGGTIQFTTAVSRGVLRMVVKDYGKGIPSEHLISIFEPYTQVKSGNDTEYTTTGGTGLGLTLTKMLITGLGGTITVDSREGEWTEFVVELPLRDPPASSAHGGGLLGSASASAAAASLPPASPVPMASRPLASNFMTPDSGSPRRMPTARAESLRMRRSEFRPPLLGGNSAHNNNKKRDGCHILIADDNIVNQKILVRLLQKLGLDKVDVVLNGRQAVEQATKHSYDLIFMDVEMPVLNGIQAAKEICAQQDRPKIAFSTAHQSLDIYRHELEGLSSCRHFISKPFELAQIESVIDELLFSESAESPS